MKKIYEFLFEMRIELSNILKLYFFSNLTISTRGIINFFFPKRILLFYQEKNTSFVLVIYNFP